MCPPSKPKRATHPLLDSSVFNSLHVDCVIIMTHDVLSANSPHLICTDCYNPAIYNRVLTQYSHTFQYGNVPTNKCANCGKNCYERRSFFECIKCVKAYNQLVQMITKKGEENTYRQIVGLSVNSATLRIDYGVAEIRINPNDPEVLEERLTN